MVKSARRSRSHKRSNRRSIRSRKSQKVQSGGGINDDQKQKYAKMLRILSNDDKLDETIKDVENSINNMTQKLVDITYDEKFSSTVFSSKELQKSKDFIDKTIKIMKQIPLSSQIDGTKHFMSTIIEKYKSNSNDIKVAIKSGVTDLSSELSTTLEKYTDYVINLLPTAKEGLNKEKKLARLQEIYNEMFNDDNFYRLIYTYHFLNSLKNKCGQDKSSSAQGAAADSGTSSGTNPANSANSANSASSGANKEPVIVDVV